LARKSDKRKRKRSRSEKKVSEKIAHLIRSGEKSNTATGRKEAAGMAYGMEQSGRLGRHGKYKKKKKGGKGGAGVSRPTKEPNRADKLRGYRRRTPVSGKYG